MELTVSRTDETVAVAISGRFDANEIDLFRRTTDPELVDVVRLEVDLARVVFLDSSALAELMRLRGQILAGGGSFAVVELSDPVRIIFDVTDLLRVLVPDDRDATAVAEG